MARRCATVVGYRQYVLILVTLTLRRLPSLITYVAPVGKNKVEIQESVKILKTFDTFERTRT